MQRNIFSRVSLLVLCALMGFAQPKFSIAPNAAGLESIIVYAAGHPTFNTFLSEQRVPSSPAWKTYLPLSVLVENRGEVPVIGITVSYEVRLGDKRANNVSQVGSRSFGSDVPSVIPAHSKMFFAPEQYYTKALNDNVAQSTEHEPPASFPLDAWSRSDAITFYLDSVLLADGCFLGPDFSQSYDRYAAQLTARRTIDSALEDMREAPAAVISEYLRAQLARRPILTEPFSSRGRDDETRAALKVAKSKLAVLENSGASALLCTSEVELAKVNNFNLHR